MSQVYVGLSGGVDSSVSALLLKQQGHTVTGAFIEAWQPEGLPCSQEQDRIDAMRVAAELNIPFVLIDAKEAYRTRVAEYMIEGYRRGETPNPDIMCNREIKFGILYDHALKAGADFVATGHYARREEVIDTYKTTSCALRAGVDAEKDQSYFLWTLPQDTLAHTLFPIGHLRKQDVREIASAHGLSTATKKDSQGLCFLGKLDLPEFLGRYIKSNEGVVLDLEGNTIGTHPGAAFFTLGQRHGFLVHARSSEQARLYVVAKDVVHNTLTVSEEKITQYAQTDIALEEINWIRTLPRIGAVYQARIRYRQPLFPVVITALGDGVAQVTTSEPQLAARGQSLVVYSGEECMGGGIVADNPVT